MELITNDIELFLGLGTFFFSTYLGFMVFLQKPKSWTNRFFLILALLIDNYIWINYLSLHPPLGTPENQFFWIRAVMFITSFIGPTLFLLVHTFPREKITLPKKYKTMLLVLMLSSAALAFTPWMFSELTYPNGQPMPVPAPGIIVFLLDFIGLFIASFVLLAYRFIKASPHEKKPLLHFLVGTIISFSLMGLGNVILVIFFKESSAVFLGPIYPIILMIFIAYAIIKHGIFSVKVVATKLLVALIGIALFTRIFFSRSITNTVIDSVALVIVIFFGYFLVQSVRNEIQRREEITRLVKKLEKANARLQELDQLKTEFLSIASHQLRTPLSIIKGYTELLAEGAYGDMSRQSKRVLKNVDESNEHLIRLVDEFLNISRIEQERTQFHFAPCHVKNCMDGIAAELKPKARGKRIRLHFLYDHVPETIIADEDKIRHAIYNFVDNAIKYSPNNSEVFVSAKGQGRRLMVQVLDQGVGLTSQEKKNLFQKFYRAPRVMRDFQGTGLGIYVAKQFVEAHGGRIWAKSRGVEKGSEFGFSIPKNGPNKRKKIKNTHPKKKLAKKRK